MSRKPPKSRVRRRARANPKPRAWSAKGPSRAYECKSPLVGRTVRLGRSEAVVESCATPSRRRPNQGQFRVRSKATGKSRAVLRRRVSAALYRAKHPRKMPAGLLKFWSKTREGGSARPSMAEAYGPRESLGVGAFEEARALPYGPRESLGVGAFEEGRRRARSASTQESIQQAVHRVVMQFAAIGGWRIEAWRSGSRSKWLREPQVTRYFGRAFCSVKFHTNGEVRVNIVAGGTANIDNWLVASDVRRTDAASIMGIVGGRFAEQQTAPRESLTSDTDPTAPMYGPRESLGTGAFEERRALPAPTAPTTMAPAARKRPARRAAARSSNAPELPLHFGFGAGTADPLRPDRRHAPLPSAHFGPGGAEATRHVPLGYGPGGFEEGRRHHAWTEPTTDAQVHEHIAQFDDVIALKRERHETIPQEWLDRRAALAARLSGASLPRGIASALVFGHPQATTVHPETYGHLVPIVATSVDSIERRLQETQEHFARLSQLIAKVQDTAKNGKGAARKRAQQELKSHDFAEAQVVRDLLHTETRTELNRLLRALSADRAVRAEAKEVLDRRPSASPSVISDEAREQMRDNPMRWRANHHGGWHAPGDPLGYGPRANRTRRARKTRKARKPSR